MRTRFSSHLSVRPARSVPAVNAADSGAIAASTDRQNARSSFSFGATQCLTLVMAVAAPFCAGALLARPVQAAPTVESDENGPLVQIIKPGYNDILKGKYRILIQVTARKYNPQSVEMFIDDVSATDGPMEISSFASSSYDFDTRKMTDGRHKLTVRVTDSQGFRGWSEVTVFVNNKGAVDTQAPDLRWVDTKPFQEFSGSMKIEVDAADNFGVKMLQLSISPADAPDKPAYSWMMNQPPYKVNLDTVGKNIPDGLYVLKALAFDSLDQQGEAPPLTIGIVNDQINATRVEDMLDGKKQMAQLLQSQTPVKNAPAKATEAPAKVAEAPTKVAEAPTKVTEATDRNIEARTNAATASTKADKVLGKTAEAPAVATARSSEPTAQTRTAPPATAQTRTAPPATAPAQTAPALLPPSLKIPQQTLSNPGIQLPRVKAPALSTPTPAATPQVAEETRIAQLAPAEVGQAEVAPQPEATPTAVAPAETEVAPQTEVAPAETNSAGQIETAPAETDSSEQTFAQTSANQASEVAPTEAATVEAMPAATVAQTQRTLIAKLPSLPIGQRNAGEASLSHAAAVDLAITPASSIETARASAPIAVARFGQPHLSGRAISDAPAWSQNGTGDASRLSNAELSRARSSKTRVLSAPLHLAPQIAAPALKARALQTSVPTLSPMLGRAVTADSLRAPATKLTRQAQTQVAPSTGTLAKAVTKSERAKPLEVAPAFVARNVANAAPQLSVPTTPRMSESASGLGVPSKLAKAVQRLTGKPQKGASLDGERIAALPRPDAASNRRGGAAIVAVPLNEPLQIADATAVSIPASYRAEKTTTLRAIAARYGLPVELVAISNGWTSDMKVLRGMEVKLPRPLDVSYNGAPVKGDAPSMLMGDTAVTAFRFMFEKSGGKLEWDAAHQRVIARKDGREIVLSIGSNVAKVGDREVMMEIAAFLFQGRTMVPLRLFEEGMNAQVEWNPQTGRLVVAMAG